MLLKFFFYILSISNIYVSSFLPHTYAVKKIWPFENLLREHFELSAILKLIKAESSDFVFYIYGTKGVQICCQNNCKKNYKLDFLRLEDSIFFKV